MALTTLVSSFLLFPLLHAQVVPVGGTCTVDDCLTEFVPSYTNGTADWAQITSCIDYQSVPVTTTYTSFVYVPDITSTLIRTGCPTKRAVDWNKRQITQATEAIQTTIMPDVIASEPDPCPTSTGLVYPNGCSREQVASICECAFFVPKYSVTQTTTWTATLGNIYYTEEFISCSTTSSPCPTAGWTNTSSTRTLAGSSITGSASVSWFNVSSSATPSTGWNASTNTSPDSVIGTASYLSSGTAVSGWPWSSSSSAMGWNFTSTTSTPVASIENATSSSIASESTVAFSNTSSTMKWPTITIDLPTETSSVSIPVLTTGESFAGSLSASSSAPPFPFGNSSTALGSGTGVVSSSLWLTSATSSLPSGVSAETASSAPETSSSTASGSTPEELSSSASATTSFTDGTSYSESSSSSTQPPIQVTDTAGTPESSTTDDTETATPSPSSVEYSTITISGNATSIVTIATLISIDASSGGEESSTITLTTTRTSSIFSTATQSIIPSSGNASSFGSASTSTSSTFSTLSQSGLPSSTNASTAWNSTGPSSTPVSSTETTHDYGYGTNYDHSSTASSTLISPSSTLVSPVIPSSSSSCVPSYLNSTWSTFGYQPIYAADYAGCALDPYDQNIGFQLVSIATQEKIVNINGKAQIPRNQADYEDAYYSFEQNADLCGVFDIVFHWEDEKSYFAVDPQESVAVFERHSSFGQQQRGSNSYMTSIWSVDCAGELRAGTIGGTQLMFDVGQNDRKLRVTTTAFVAHKSKRTVRKREGGMHLMVVPVNVDQIEARKSMKKMLKKTSFNRGQK